MFSEEVQFCLPNGVHGPHGLIDLLVGPKLHFGDQDSFVTVTYEKSSLHLKDLVLGGAKSAATPLAPASNSVDP